MRKEKALQCHGKEMRLDNLPQGQALQDQKWHVCQVEALVAARKVRRWELLSECNEHLDIIRTHYTMCNEQVLYVLFRRAHIYT